MLRLLNKKSLSTVSKQSFAKAFVIPTRKFSVNSVLRHNDDGDGNNVPHSHTHNGQPCGGHSHNHSHGNSQPLLDSDGNPIKLDKPMLMLAFTCKKCDVRSSHVVSKQAYTHGSVLVQCPGCKGRHLVSDHLKVRNPHIFLSPLCGFQTKIELPHIYYNEFNTNILII